VKVPIQRAFFCVRLRIPLRIFSPCIIQSEAKNPGSFFPSQRLKRSLAIRRFCFEITHIAFRHRKPQDNFPADFVFGAS